MCRLLSHVQVAIYQLTTQPILKWLTVLERAIQVIYLLFCVFAPWPPPQKKIGNKGRFKCFIFLLYKLLDILLLDLENGAQLGLPSSRRLNRVNDLFLTHCLSLQLRVLSFVWPWRGNCWNVIWILNLVIGMAFRLTPPISGWVFMTPSASVVHYKVCGSYISRPVWPRISKFYMDIHTDLVFSHAKYDVTSYFQSVFIEVRKTAENAPSDGFRSNFSVAALCLVQPIGELLVFFSPRKPSAWTCFFLRSFTVEIPLPIELQ